MIHIHLLRDQADIILLLVNRRLSDIGILRLDSDEVKLEEANLRLIKRELEAVDPLTYLDPPTTYLVQVEVEIKAWESQEALNEVENALHQLPQVIGILDSDVEEVE